MKPETSAHVFHLYLSPFHPTSEYFINVSNMVNVVGGRNKNVAYRRYQNKRKILAIFFLSYPFL